MRAKSFTISLLWSLLLWSLLLIAGGQSAAGVAEAAVTAEMKVGVYENPPKLYSEPGGRPAGLFVELLEAVAKEERWRIVYVPCHWEECLRLLETGELDLMPDVAYSDARSLQFDFHEVPVAFSWSQAFARPGHGVRSIPDLHGQRVAVLRGSVQQQELQHVLGGIGAAWIPVETASFEDAFAAVRDGRADVAVANNYFGRRAAKSFGLVETPLLFNPASLYFAAGVGRHARELERLDAWISRWRDEPGSIYFQALSRALAPPPATVAPGWLGPLVVSSAAAILALGGFVLVLRWRVRRARESADGARVQLEQVLEASPVVLLLGHQEGDRFVLDWVSGNVMRLYGFWIGDMMNPGWWATHVHPDDLQMLRPEVDMLREQPEFVRDYRILDAKGRVRHLQEYVRAMPQDAGGGLRVLVTWTDRSEAKAHADELSFAATHDGLTGLPNRLLLETYLEEAIEAGTPLAVLVVDLDRLRGINDTLGHSVGDRALRVAALRMQEALPAGGVLARLGGDEFAILLPGAHTGEELDVFSRSLQDRFVVPLLAPEHPAVISASVGGALFPDDASDAGTLLQHAELALYEAKRHGPGQSRRFESALSTGASHRLAVESGLRAAIASGELRLHFQPQVALEDLRRVGVEALVRWQHPEWGLVQPGQFISVAEESGLIDELGTWVIKEACRQLRAWDDVGMGVACMSVNCSVQQLDVDRLPAQVSSALRTTGVAAERLELEITESMLMREPERAIETLQALQDLGVRVAIDDFGTGHSSLAYLKRLPVNRLKLDRSFVSGIGTDPNDEQICRTVIALAKNLGLQILAEGVEHDHEAEFLRAEGCELAQGYLYARPLAADELEAWWAAGHRGPEVARRR